MITATAQRLLYAATLALSLGMTSEICAKEGADDDAGAAASEQAASAAGIEDDAFHVGGSCAALAYMTTGRLNELIKTGFSDDRHSFCFPEEPSECSDYSGLLQGMGKLSVGEDGYHCDLQTQF